MASWQQQRILDERSRWDELKQLASEDNVSQFWTRYADYLEWNNVVSPRRQALYHMARLTAKVTKDPSTNTTMQGE